MRERERERVREKEREGERNTLTAHQIHNLGFWGQGSNQSTYPASGHVGEGGRLGLVFEVTKEGGGDRGEQVPSQSPDQGRLKSHLPTKHKTGGWVSASGGSL